MWTLSWVFVPFVLYFSWVSYIVSAGAGCVLWFLNQCRAFLQQSAGCISSYGCKTVSSLQASPLPGCRGRDAAHSADSRDTPPAPAHPRPPPSESHNSSPRPTPTPTPDARLGRRSLGSWVRIWDATRKAQEPSDGGPASSSWASDGRPDAKSSRASSSSARSRCRPPIGRSPFLPEDQVYLCHRLPLSRPPTAHTVKLHFARLPFVYQDLADRCLARAARMAPGLARDRRQRMWVLATRLAKRYRGLDVVLSDRFVKGVLDKNSSVKRPSKFWENVLEEVEKANASWSLTRIWIAFCIAQSALVALIAKVLPPAAQAALMAANAVAFMWSVNVLWGLVHARYAVRKADEQELHDIMGGL